MPAYILVELTEILDTETLKEYQKLTPKTIEDHGGKFIVRGGDTVSLEGNWDPQRIVILEFESMQAAKDWYHSEAYQQASEFRRKAAHARFLLLEGYSG